MATKGFILFIIVSITLFQFSLSLTLTGLFQGSKGPDGMRGEETRVAEKRVVHDSGKANAVGVTGGRSGGTGEAGSGAGSSSSSPDAAGGAAVIPVYAAGSAKDNHHHNRRHSAGNINHPHSLIRLSALAVAIALSLLVNLN